MAQTIIFGHLIFANNKRVCVRQFAFSGHYLAAKLLLFQQIAIFNVSKQVFRTEVAYFFIENQDCLFRGVG